MPSPLLLAFYAILEASLIFFCVAWRAPAIEEDLFRASEQALARREIDLGKGLVIDGRDAWLTGLVTSEIVKTRAERTVAAVPGIRVVRNMLAVSPEPVPAPAQLPVAVTTKAGVQRAIDNLIGERVVEFESASATLTDRGRALVDEVAMLLLQSPDAAIEIGGHTDSRGPSRDNLDLSRRRAGAVRLRLIELGVEESRLTANGYGEGRPIADNNVPDGRLKNRRVTFTVQ